MEIKDLAGLSEPLTKLIEVISIGVGKVTNSHIIKKDAKARAYEIDMILQALEKNKELLGKGEYKDGTINLEMGKLDYTTRENKALQRVVYQEVRRQENIEQITQNAAEELAGVKDVSTDKVEVDWITRFFNIVQNISSEEMQVLWSRILAGEVRNPGSYSMRTLELMRNITTQEAKVISKAFNLCVKADIGAFIIDNEQFLREYFDLSLSDFLLLEELGLIQRELGFEIKNDPHVQERELLKYGNKTIEVIVDAGSGDQSVDVHKLTNVGREILSLISIEPKETYVKELLTLFNKPGINAHVREVPIR